MKNILFTLALLISFNSFGQTEEVMYYPNGAVKVKFNVVDDKLQGEAINYYESGAVEFKENYVDNKRQGEMIYYNKNGEIEKIENYKDDVLIKD